MEKFYHKIIIISAIHNIILPRCLSLYSLVIVTRYVLNAGSIQICKPGENFWLWIRLVDSTDARRRSSLTCVTYELKFPHYKTKVWRCGPEMKNNADNHVAPSKLEFQWLKVAEQKTWWKITVDLSTLQLFYFFIWMAQWQIHIHSNFF